MIHDSVALVKAERMERLARLLWEAKRGPFELDPEMRLGLILKGRWRGILPGRARDVVHRRVWILGPERVVKRRIEVGRRAREELLAVVLGLP